MTRKSAPPDIGVPVKHKPGQWVQTERKAHEAWAMLGLRKPVASALLHKLTAQMGHQNAVVVSQKVLAQVLGVHERTVRRAIADLVDEKWIQVVRLGKGKEAAYVVNDRVAWGQPRDQLCLSVFSATVVADIQDQDAATIEHVDLRRIPTLYPGEMQLPTGPGEDPPSQPSIPGMEPDLPALQGDAAERFELERRGQQRLDVDTATQLNEMRAMIERLQASNKLHEFDALPPELQEQIKAAQARPPMKEGETINGLTQRGNKTVMEEGAATTYTKPDGTVVKATRRNGQITRK